MKPLRRLLLIIALCLSIVAFIISMVLLIPAQYLFTGKTDIIDIEAEIIDELINRISPDK